MWSYSGDPASSVQDSIRFLIGDTDGVEPLLSDEEIKYLVDQWYERFSVYYTASMAAQSIAARFAREVTLTSDSQTVAASELQSKYAELAVQLMNHHMQLLAGGTVDVGGILVGGQPDPTVLPMAFGTGMHDNPEAGNQDFGDQQAPIPYPEWGYR